MPQSRLFERFAPFFDVLETLYAEMDQAYDAAAQAYGFHCNGCADNCCLTRFYHHTLIEFLYLRNGFAGLAPAEQKAITDRAEEVNREVARAEKSAGISRVMCPLNIDGLCRLYPFRPMICRLHGIPHEFQHPVQGRVRSPGCHEFDARCGKHDYIVFDRTSFYRQLGKLEQDVRKHTGYTAKIKKTVARMLAEGMEKIL